MESDHYRVIFTGQLLEGYHQQQAASYLQATFNFSPEKIEKLFDKAPVLIKKNVSRQVAERLAERLRAGGMITRVEEIEAVKVPLILPTPRNDVAAQTQPAIEASAPKTTPPPPPLTRRRLAFRFSGEGGEYFRIWIVNILLSIVTLGIYSAWAKVRNNRYFYSNTKIDSHSFSYLANPVTILKGRLLALGVFFVYLLSTAFVPLLELLFLPAFVLLFPWLVCRVMAFRLHNTSFRGVRFGFDGTYGQAFVAFVLWPLAMFLTAGILTPLALQRQAKFLVDNSRYGGQRFSGGFSAKNFYRIYLVAMAAMVGIVALCVMAGIAVFQTQSLALPGIFLISLSVVTAYLLMLAYVRVMTTNLIYNTTVLDEQRFDCRLETFPLAGIYLTNWLLIIVTLGLAIPWAKVRMARYQAQCLTLVAAGALDQFVAEETKKVAPFGEEIGEAFALDIGL